MQSASSIASASLVARAGTAFKHIRRRTVWTKRTLREAKAEKESKSKEVTLSTLAIVQPLLGSLLPFKASRP